MNSPNITVEDGRAHSQVDWLPRTKLEPDPHNGYTIVRSRLLDTLQGAFTRFRLVLVSAPTGYGKSTLLRTWLQYNAQRLKENTRPFKAAWLSVDGSENDRSHFLLALVTALQTLHPKCGKRAERFLLGRGYPRHIDPATQIEILSGLIVIDVLQYLTDPFVLILDNYERISEPTVHQGLDYLLRRLPPQACVVVSTTEDPPLSITRLCRYGLATQLRMDDLAFDEVESMDFLDNALDISLPTAQKRVLHHYSEGWPLGLHLVAQELTNVPSEQVRVQFIDDLFDAAGNPLILPSVADLFQQDVFNNLPRRLRYFLMQTSMLSALARDVCRTVSGLQDAEDVLNDIYRRNLFLTRPAEAHNAPTAQRASAKRLYCYHRLFAAYLRRRLEQEMPDQWRRLHKLAAQVEPDPSQAITYYLTVECWREAEQIAANLRDLSDTSHEMRSRVSRALAVLPSDVRQKLPNLQYLTANHIDGLPVGPSEGSRQGPVVTWGLTARQVEVLALVSTGASNQEIADELVISMPTVKSHMSQIMRRLEVATRRDAAERATALGILPN